MRWLADLVIGQADGVEYEIWTKHVIVFSSILTLPYHKGEASHIDVNLQ